MTPPGSAPTDFVDEVVARLRSHAKPARSWPPCTSGANLPINALTNRSHPCQILADLMTIEEVCGPLARQTVVYIGDGNNIAVSLIEAAELMGFSLVVITPPGYAPPADVVDGRLPAGRRGSGITLSTDVADVAGATAIYTDVWASMGQESEREVRHKAFAGYQVNSLPLLARARVSVLCTACIPEMKSGDRRDVDGRAPVVFQQAANRLYAQMALMAQLLNAAACRPAVPPAARRGGPPPRLGRGNRRCRGRVCRVSAAALAARHAGHADPGRSRSSRSGGQVLAARLNLVLLGWLFQAAGFFILIGVIVVFRPSSTGMVGIGRLSKLGRSRFPPTARASTARRSQSRFAPSSA